MSNIYLVYYIIQQCYNCILLHMKQTQNVNEMKINIAKIISDCKGFKFNIYSEQSEKVKHKLKTQQHHHQNLIKSLDFDDCVKNIRRKAHSLHSSNSSYSPLKPKDSSHKLTHSQHQIPQSPKRICTEQTQQKSATQLPRLLRKYREAYSPKNASSSQKCSLIQKSSKSAQKQQDESFSLHRLLGERRKAQQIRKMFIMSKIMKQNVIKQKKILINKKKQRRLQNLNLKQITLSKTCIPNK